MKTKFILHGGFEKGKTEENMEDFYTEILKDAPEYAKILLVTFAKDEDRILTGTERVKVEFNKCKWQQSLTFDVSKEESFITQIKLADIVYFHGGRSLVLLERLKKYPNLKDSLNGKIVAGESAGAIVLGKYFYSASAQIVSEGLGLLPFKIIPHYTDMFKDKLDGVGIGLELLPLKEYEFKSLM
jgi:peptidase E